MKDYVLVTGAASGLAKAVLKELSGEYNFILADINSEKLKMIAEQYADNSPIIWEQDLTQIDSLEGNLADILKENEITVSKFVHCAGSLNMVPCKRIQTKHLIETYSINVFSAALIIKALTSRKVNKAALNSAVLISSNGASRGVKAFAIYGSSKAAIDGLVRNLAVELAPAVRVNSIQPGAMKTEMTAHMFNDPEYVQRVEPKYPMGTGSPEKIAPMVRFLLSDDASWVNGQQIVIDGGRSIDITD